METHELSEKHESKFLMLPSVEKAGRTLYVWDNQNGYSLCTYKDSFMIPKHTEIRRGTYS